MLSNTLVLENKICHSLYSATHALIRAYRPLLKAIGLTYPQYLVMLALWAGDQVAIKDLVRRTRLDAGTITPILQRLQSKGLLTSTKADQDSRRKQIVLTAKGRRLATKAEAIPQLLACQIQMTEQEGQALKALTEKLYAELVLPE